MRRFGKQPFAWNENVKFLNKSITADETHDEIRHEDSDNGHQNETNVKRYLYLLIIIIEFFILVEKN